MMVASCQVLETPSTVKFLRGENFRTNQINLFTLLLLNRLSLQNKHVCIDIASNFPFVDGYKVLK